MIEVEGPSTSFFEVKGTRYIYSTYALASQEVGDLVLAYAKWRAKIENSFACLVWRRKPQFTYNNVEDVWSISFKFCIVPVLEEAHDIPRKPEGDFICRV